MENLNTRSKSWYLVHWINANDSVVSEAQTRKSHLTSHNATVSLPSDDQLQQAANYAVSWCDSNKMLLNSSKSTSIFISTQKKITTIQLIIIDSAVSKYDAVKLLGMTLDLNLCFPKHGDTLINRCRPVFMPSLSWEKQVNKKILCISYKTHFWNMQHPAGSLSPPIKIVSSWRNTWVSACV